MGYQKELTLVLWVIALFGMFFLARGITGNIVANSFIISDTCTNDKECPTNKICCVINGIGSCSTSEICNQLIDYNKEKPLSKANNFDIGLGLLILLCILIASYSTLRARKNKFRHVKKAKRRR